MMRRIVAILVIIGVVLVGGGGYFCWRASQPAAPEAPKAAMDESHTLQPTSWDGANPQPGVYVRTNPARSAPASPRSRVPEPSSTAQMIVVAPAAAS